MLSLKQVLNKVGTLVQAEEWIEIKQLIFENKLENSNHVEIICALANIYVMEDNLEQAEKVIVRGIQKHEFNIDMNFNAGVIYDLKGKYKEAFYHFSWVKILNKNSSDELLSFYLKKMTEVLLAEDVQKIEQEVLKLSKNIYIQFPENFNGSYIGNTFQISNHTYYVGLYQSFPCIHSSQQGNPVEIMKGKEYNDFSINTDVAVTIPVMARKSTGNFRVVYGNEKVHLENALLNRYAYYTFPENQQVTFSDSFPFVVGKPICHTYDKKKPRLVLSIYVDSLSQYFLDKLGLENAMPNTAEFFKKGTICTQNYTACEWTYPSAANIFTGKYTINHRLFHPKYNSKVLHKQTLFPEVLQQNGYYTTMVDCNWRTSPLNGYVKGFDRVHYRHNYFGGDAAYMISDAIEQMDSLKGTNHFLSLCLFDLHDVSERFPLSVSAQVAMEAKYHELRPLNMKSVDMDYDSHQVEQYRVQLLKLDRMMEHLYTYLIAHYTDDEMLVALISDHGLGFLKDSHYLDNHNVHIPMMFRGGNVPKGECKEITQSVDYFSILCHCLGLEAGFMHDGNLPVWFGGTSERKYALAESLYPNRPYGIIFYEKDIKIHFTSKGNTTNDGRISGDEGFYGKVFDIQTDKEVTNRYPDKLEKYSDLVYQHIKEYLL